MQMNSGKCLEVNEGALWLVESLGFVVYIETFDFDIIEYRKNQYHHNRRERREEGRKGRGEGGKVRRKKNN